MGTETRIEVLREDGVAVFEITGDVTSASESAFTDAYRSLAFGESGKIVLRFQEESYINSGGIAVLIQLLAETHRNRQKIGITGLSPHFQKIFRMVGITRFAGIYPSAEEAKKSLGA